MTKYSADRMWRQESTHLLKNLRTSRSIKRPAERAAPERRGVLAVELLLALPVVVIIVLAMIEFSLILIARQQLTAASREGARVAAVGGTEDDITSTVKTFLGTGALAAAEVDAVIRDSDNNLLPSGAPVQVAVHISTGKVVPNFLALFGFSIAKDVMVASTVMRKE